MQTTTSRTETSATTMTREGWLMEMTERMRPWFNEVGVPLPDVVHVSVGWPSRGGLGQRSRTIGQCWAATATKDGAPQVFISPILDDAVEAAHTLVHELVHAAGKRGHGAEFGRPAKALGLTGKMTATVASDELRARLEDIIGEVGPYPHSGFDPVALAAQPKQSTRMLKVECPEDEGGCGCVVRMTRKWLNDIGAPTCGCGTPMVAVDA